MNLLGKRTSKQPANVHAQCVPQADYDKLKQQLDQANIKIIDLQREVELLNQKIKDLEEELDSPIIG